MKVVFTRSSNIYDDSRATKEITALLDSGYFVSVLGWNRDGKANDQCERVFAKYNQQISFYFYDGNTGDGMIGKLFSRFLWAKWLKKNLDKIHQIDVIHSCDYDTGNTVRRFAKKNNIKYIYDIFDYYIDAHPVPSFLKSYIEKKEIQAINNAELCIICTEERREQIMKARPKEVLVIHNSPDVVLKEDVEEEFDYVYCGSLYNGRLISEIFDAFEDNNDFRFAVAGYGMYAEKAKQLSNVYSNFTFLGSIPYSQVLEIERKSKVISAIYDPSIRNHRLCAPNKFYEALALAKPVIVCKGTGIDEIVEKNKIGIVIDYDESDFYAAVRRLIGNNTLRKEMGSRARQLYDSEYRWDIMRKKLIDKYKKILC